MIPVRVLAPQDAEIMARSIETGVVSNGRVERFDLQWKSDAMRTWEVEQRCLGRKPTVSIRIDELDLSIAYVETLVGARQTFRAVSTKPMYTRYLSLYEHRRLKEMLKTLALKDRLVRMSDQRAFDLRIQYYAELGRQNDPVAYRRLVELRDQLAALRLDQSDAAKVESTVELPNTKVQDPNLPRSESPQNPAKTPKTPKRSKKAVKPKQPAKQPVLDSEPSTVIEPDSETPTDSETANHVVNEPRSETTQDDPNEMPNLPFPVKSIKRTLL